MATSTCSCPSPYVATQVVQADGSTKPGCVDNTGNSNPYIYTCDGTVVGYSGADATQSTGTLGNNGPAPFPSIGDILTGASTSGWTATNWETFLLNGGSPQFWFIVAGVFALFIVLAVVL